METVGMIALALGVAWASGIKLYAAVLTLGLLGATGNVVLPEKLQVLAHPWVIGVAGFLYLMEFIADKIPGVDSAWDAVHTFIRIPAGAVLAMGAVGTVDPLIATLAFLAGGAISTGSHGAKMSTRLAINTSPEPFSNWGASIGEDAAVAFGLYTAFHHPLVFLVLLAVFIGLVIWLLPKIFRLFKQVGARIAGAFG
jgi:hypothetical protein